MKKISVFSLFLLLLLFTFAVFGQQIDRVYKENGVWKGDLSQPIDTYPIKGAIIADTSAIPDPPVTVPIPPTPLTSVDNTDASVVYAGGGWYSGPTTAQGFYPAQPNSTIAYAAAAGNTATLTFTGTTLEVYCEKKAGHGSGKFKVDASADTTINLGVAGPVGSTLVYKKNFAAGQHIFKLTIVGNGNVVLDYIKINGTVVVPPTPPVTGDIIVQPGQSIKAAVESAAAGKKVKIMPGTYLENTVNVPVGVSILTEGRDKTFIDFTGSHAQGDNAAIFSFSSSSRQNGNQTISGLTIRGKNLANGGVYVDNRDNVVITDVKIQETTFFGAWGRNANNWEVSYSEFYNSSSGASSARNWATGEICVFNLRGMKIHHNYIHTDRIEEGYGIKALWENGSVNGAIYSNNIQMYPTSLWNGGGPNISIELPACYYDGIEIYDNDIVNTVSLAAHKPTKSGRVVVRNNRFKMLSATNGVIELVCSNVTIEANTVTGDAIFTANYQPNGKWVDQIVTNNDFTSDGSNPPWGGTFLIGANGADMTITNNRFKNMGSNYPFVKYMGSPAGSSVVNSGNTFTP